MLHTRQVGISALVVCFLSLMAVAQDSAPATQPSLTYKLQPGQVITYEASSRSGGSMNASGTMRARASVLAGNPDGSHRVLLAVHSTFSFGDGPADESSDVIAFDLSPQGRITNQTRTYLDTASRLFPPLPETGQVRWEQTGDMGDVTTYRLGDDGDDGRVTIHTTMGGPMVEIYGMEEETALTFDPARGLFTAGVPSELPAAAEDAFPAEGMADRMLAVTFAGVQANCHFFSRTEIEFDIDPRQVIGQEQLDVLVAFMRLLAAASGKDAVMTPEGLEQVAIFGVSPRHAAIEYRPFGPC